MAVHVGTSGFVYRHWRGIFYPEDLPTKQRLAHFCGEFRTCELNTTFYRLDCNPAAAVPEAAAACGRRTAGRLRSPAAAAPDPRCTP